MLSNLLEITDKYKETRNPSQLINRKRTYSLNNWFELNYSLASPSSSFHDNFFCSWIAGSTKVWFRCTLPFIWVYKVRALVKRIENTRLWHSFYRVHQCALQKTPQLWCDSSYFNLNSWLLAIVANTEKAKFWISRGSSSQIKPMFTKYLIAINEASQIYFKSEQVLLATEILPYVVGLILKTVKKLKLLLTSKYQHTNDQQQKVQGYSVLITWSEC